MTEEILTEISDCIVGLDIDEIVDLVDRALESGIPASIVVSSGMSPGVNNVCRKFQKGEILLSELAASSEAVKKGMDQLEPHLKREGASTMGRVLIGEAKGATTGGSKIVANLLAGAGFDVHHLGTDICEYTTVEKVKDIDADIIAISVVVSSAAPQISTVVEALKRAGLRERVKLIIGGQQAASNKLGRDFGADAIARDACDGIRICREWMEARQDIA